MNKLTIDHVIPVSSKELTPKWFTQILKTPISSVNLQPLGETDSVTGNIYRAKLTYKTQTNTKPASVIVKIPYPIKNRLQILTTMHEREINFYNILAPKMNLKIPKALYSNQDKDKGSYVLVLEDFPHHTPGKNTPGATLQQSYLLLDQMAKLHAYWWENPILSEYKFLGSLEEYIKRCTSTLPSCLPRFLRRFGSDIHPDEYSVFEALPERFNEIASPLLDAPQTLVHHDLTLKNTLIHEDNQEIVIIDWQLAYWNTGVRDVSFYVEHSVSPLIRSEHEKDFLRYYWKRLCEEGVCDYPFESLFDHYRRSVFCDLGRIVMIGGTEGEKGEVISSILRHGILGRTGSAKELELNSFLN